MKLTPATRGTEYVQAVTAEMTDLELADKLIGLIAFETDLLDPERGCEYDDGPCTDPADSDCCGSCQARMLAAEVRRRLDGR